MNRNKDACDLGANNSRTWVEQWDVWADIIMPAADDVIAVESMDMVLASAPDRYGLHSLIDDDIDAFRRINPEALKHAHQAVGRANRSRLKK